jgi:hypothetical protein
MVLVVLQVYQVHQVQLVQTVLLAHQGLVQRRELQVRLVQLVQAETQELVV